MKNLSRRKRRKGAVKNTTRPKKGKLSKRVPAALTTWLKKMNPSKMRGVTRVRVKKLKGGGVTITPARFS